MPLPTKHPRATARLDPERPAIIMAATGDVTTFGMLERAANRGAHRLRAAGIRSGDTIALLCGNAAEHLEAVWAADRSGVYYVCLSTHLTAPELAYILTDSGSRLLLAAQDFEAIARAAAALVPGVSVVSIRPEGDRPEIPIRDEAQGHDMLYSSGTTGRPKGIRAGPSKAGEDALDPLTAMLETRFGFGASTRYLCPAPLYHAAPLRWCLAVHRLGGTVVLLERFDAESALSAIERYRITAGQWVPTHFVRLLKLSPSVRNRYDLSSQRLAVHAAAPCPISVKQAIIDWWGPIVLEYYAGSEGNGLTAIASDEWLRKPGSVGRALIGTVHICDDSGEPRPIGEEGIVYFEGGGEFSYQNDAARTAAAANRYGWTTLGDVGRLDADVYLFLTDRRDFMIISGGVNIYPRAIEDRLIAHPAVADVAVFGIPDAEMGERVIAVVEPADGICGDDTLATALIAWARGALSGIQIPRRIDFVSALPRHANGKLYKRLLRERYLGKVDTLITS